LHFSPAFTKEKATRRPPVFNQSFTANERKSLWWPELLSSGIHGAMVSNHVAITLLRCRVSIDQSRSRISLRIHHMDDD